MTREEKTRRVMILWERHARSVAHELELAQDAQEDSVAQHQQDAHRWHVRIQALQEHNLQLQQTTADAVAFARSAAEEVKASQSRVAELEDELSGLETIGIDTEKAYEVADGLPTPKPHKLQLTRRSADQVELTTEAEPDVQGLTLELVAFQKRVTELELELANSLNGTKHEYSISRRRDDGLDPKSFFLGISVGMALAAFASAMLTWWIL